MINPFLTKLNFYFKQKDPKTTAASLIVPPPVSAETIKQLVGIYCCLLKVINYFSLCVLKHELGVTNIWLQPGAESEQVYDVAKSIGAELIAGGPCVLVKLGHTGI